MSTWKGEARGFQWKRVKPLWIRHCLGTLLLGLITGGGCLAVQPNGIVDGWFVVEKHADFRRSTSSSACTNRAYFPRYSWDESRLR